ncbi:MAG: insulinase family protein, partial [Pseudomonadota bacterium]
DDLRESLVYGSWGEQALIAEYQSLDAGALEAYIDAFWSQATAEVLLYGNYQKPMVAEVYERLETLLPEGQANAMPARQVTRLQAGDNLLYAVDVPHDDAVVAWYLQGAGDSLEDRAATALTAQVMKSGFFQQLRTEQQLGYIVSAFAWPQLDVPGVVMLVQSPNTSAVGITDSMEAFMQRLLPDTDADQFERHRSALAGEIRRPDKNLWERAEYYWRSISKEQFEFDGRELLAGAVDEVSFEAWQQYYRETFLTDRHSLQVITPGAAAEFPELGQRRFDSAGEIKAQQGVYQVPRS